MNNRTRDLYGALAIKDMLGELSKPKPAPTQPAAPPDSQRIRAASSTRSPREQR